MANLQSRIESVRERLEAIPKEDPNRVAYLTDLGDSLANRYSKEGLPSDLQDSIRFLQEAIDLTPDDLPIPASYLDSLERRLRKSYSGTGNLRDLDQDTEPGTSHGNLSPIQRLNILSDWLSNRYLETRDMSDLEQSINIGQLLIRTTTDEHRGRVAYLNSLATALSYRYEKTKSINDLDKCIQLLKEALHLTKEKHPNRPPILSNLSLQIHDRYSSTGNVDDLDESIDLIQDAINLTQEDHPNRPVYLHNLSVRLSDRYSMIRSMDDLERSIQAVQEAIDLAGDNDPNRPLYFHNLRLRLDDRYSKTREEADLERSNQAARESLRGMGPNLQDILGHLERRRNSPSVATVAKSNPAIQDADLKGAHLLNALSRRLESRYSTTGDVTALEMAIQLEQRAVDLTPPDHADYPGFLGNLSVRLRDRYARNGTISDLERAIDLTRNALDLAPNDRIDRPAHLHNLGLQLGERYDKLRTEADLDESIRLMQEGVDKSANDHPGRALFLGNLGLQLGERFGRDMVVADIERSIELAREAVDLTPNGDESRVGRLYNLSMLLCKRYPHTGAMADLEEAIQVARDVLDATPAGHLNRRIYVGSLSQRLSDRFSRTGVMSDLEESIQCVRTVISLTPDQNPDRAQHLRELGDRLLDRYSRNGNVGDLEESIQVATESLHLMPSHEPSRPLFLNTLGSGLCVRYSRSQMMTDLEESIRVAQEAIKTTPDGHMELPMYLYNLGVRLGYRYHRTGELGDLQDSIRSIEKAANTTSRSHINWASYSTGLGARFLDRYFKTGADDDLERSINIARDVIETTPKDHPGRQLHLHVLSKYLTHRFLSRKGTADLEEAIEIGRKLVQATPEDHPDRCTYLRDLGGRLGYRFAQGISAADFDEALSYHHSALFQPNSPTAGRLEAGRAILPYYGIISHWEEAYKAACVIADLIPRLTLRSLDHSDRQYLLGRVAGLASDTAAVASLAGKGPSSALGFLEQGRGVIASSLEDVRADIVSLSKKHPQLAERFETLRDELDSGSTSLDDNQQLGETLGSQRYNAGKLFDELIVDIRKRPGFEDFLLAPGADEMLAAAVDGPVVVINVSKYQCGAIIVEQRGIRSLPLPDLDMEEIQRKAYKYYLEGQQVLEWLWDVVMKPILEGLGFAQPPSNGDWPHVWWIPTGPLTQYPLHAAGYHGKAPPFETVMDRVMSSYSTSVRALLNGRRRARPLGTDSQALIVAMEETNNHSRLPFATKEAAMLRPLMASMNITPIEPGRRKTDILSHLPQCSIFHFSGHGNSHTYDPSKSRLLLEDWKEDPLEVSNLLEINIRNCSPFLAYLSACGTGQVRNVRYMDESIHLISAFQLAGFRHAIGTLWEVNDELCVDMARITYETIRDGGLTDRSVAYGLHTATRALRDRWLNAPKEVTSKLSRKASGFDEMDRDGRDAELCDDDGEEIRGSLHWVPYVHFGV